MSLFGKKKVDPPIVTDDAAFADWSLRSARDTAIQTSDWHPAAALMKDSADPTTRQHRVRELADAYVKNGQWLDAWRHDEPNTASPQLIWACTGIPRAWAVRGGAYTEHTEEERLEKFDQIVIEAGDLLSHAITQLPNEPVLRTEMLWQGLGAGVDGDEFQRRWDAANEVSPDNRWSHIAALQYHCAKWYGSHEQMYDFAQKAAANAPEGSGNAVTVLQAHIEFLLFERDYNNMSPQDSVAFWQSPKVQEDIDFALSRWLPNGDPAPHPYVPHHRSVMAYALCHAGRWKEAKAQFEATNNVVFNYPWNYIPETVLIKMHENALTA